MKLYPQYLARRWAVKKATAINPTAAALLGGFTGPLGPAIYGGAEGGAGTGARMAGRTLLESLAGAAVGGLGGAGLGAAAGLVSPSPTGKVTLPGSLAMRGAGLGAALGGAHGAYASAQNAKKRPTKKKSEKPKEKKAMTHLEKFALVKLAEKMNPTAAGIVGALPGPAGPVWAGIQGTGHGLGQALRSGGRTAVENIGGAVAGSGIATALAMMLSKGKLTTPGMAMGVAGGIGGSMAGGAHGAYRAAVNHNRRTDPGSKVQQMIQMLRRQITGK